jgi:hypothetical protein
MQKPTHCDRRDAHHGYTSLSKCVCLVPYCCSTWLLLMVHCRLHVLPGTKLDVRVCGHSLEYALSSRLWSLFTPHKSRTAGAMHRSHPSCCIVCTDCSFTWSTAGLRDFKFGTRGCRAHGLSGIMVELYSLYTLLYHDRSRDSRALNDFPLPMFMSYADVWKQLGPTQTRH